MLNKLRALITSGDLLEKVNNPKIWDSLIVNKRKPHTYRVFSHDKETRICLHKFDTCNTDEAFPHPHPWPGAFFILSGGYNMKVGKSKDLKSDPEDVASFYMGPLSGYEITSPLTWHSVIPLATTYTVMINGPAWSPEVAHSKVRTTKGKDLGKLSPQELEDHLLAFQSMLIAIREFSK